MSVTNPNAASAATAVKEVDMSFIDEMFTPSANDIIEPEGGKPSIFSSKGVDTSFLDEPPVRKPVTEPAKPADKPAGAEPENEEPAEITSTEDIDDLLNLDKDTDAEGNLIDLAKGRPKTDKSGLEKMIKKLIESEKIVPFDDEKPLEEYTEKDYEELILANFAEQERKLKENTPQEFFNSLPKELQYAAKYVADGGSDLKGLFKALSHVEEVRTLDPKNEDDQVQICRNYLKATKFGDDAEIEDEIVSWKDLGRLELKAGTFKPKLDKMNEEIVQSQIAIQEENKKKQLDASQKYVTNVFEALKTGDINNLKLDKKTQASLYAGLTQPTYPSISGKKTNQLGHLLEKYQFVEPNHALICEALWLLSNPDDYRAEIRKQAKNEATTDTVRILKGAQASKQASSSAVEDDDKSSTRQNGGKVIKRQGNIFAR
jgi:hypothetical protein